MTIKYADHLILEWKLAPLWHHEQGLSYTASGYGNKIPSMHMVRIENRWLRVFCRIWSNIGSIYIIWKGQELHLSSEPQVGLTPRGKREPGIVGYYLNAESWLWFPGFNYEWTNRGKRDAEEDIRGFLNYVGEQGLLDQMFKDFTDEDIGTCFALNRNRHGAGFQDRNATALWKVAKTFGSTEVVKINGRFDFA